MYPSGSYTPHTDRITSISGASTLISPPSGPVTGNIGCLAELVVSRIRAHSRTIVAAAWVRVPGHRIWPRLSDAGPFIGETTRNTVASSWALQTKFGQNLAEALHAVYATGQRNRARSDPRTAHMYHARAGTARARPELAGYSRPSAASTPCRHTARVTRRNGASVMQDGQVVHRSTRVRHVPGVG